MGLSRLPPRLGFFDRAAASAFTPLLLLARLVRSLILFGLLAHDFRLIAVRQLSPGKESIIRLTPRFLTLNLKPGGSMFQVNSRSSLIDFLTATAAASNESLLQVLLTQPQRFQSPTQTFLFFLAYWRFQFSVLSCTYACR